ncbi:hypothetical protein [Bauldia litoralis]|uniref:hypothetical protein n=1 Tax=Bauldia litoralis TaxID=665467 RepID=UPI000B863EB7|nr:hypothetical protein [Bauldia litoralis]
MWALPVEIIEKKSDAKVRERREKRSEKREKHDLIAQQRMNRATKKMADYSLWQTIFVGLGTFLLIVTLFLTRQANKAARSAVAVTRRMGKVQSRAYVVVKGGALKNFGEGKHAHAVVSLINSGQTPAHGVRTKMHVGIGPYPPPTGAAFSEPPELTDAGSDGVAGPGAVLYKHVTMEDHPLTAPEVASITNGQQAIYIVGDVRYRDAFGKARTTRFRTMFTHRSVARDSEDIEVCDEGNEAD